MQLWHKQNPSAASALEMEECIQRLHQTRQTQRQLSSSAALPGSCQCSSRHAYLWASSDVKRCNSSTENGYSLYDVICQLGAVGDVQVFQQQRGFAVCLEEIPRSQVWGGVVSLKVFVVCLFVCFPLLSLRLFPNTLSIWNHFTCSGLFSIYLGPLNTDFFSHEQNRQQNSTSQISISKNTCQINSSLIPHSC